MVPPVFPVGEDFLFSYCFTNGDFSVIDKLRRTTPTIPLNNNGRVETHLCLKFRGIFIYYFQVFFCSTNYYLQLDYVYGMGNNNDKATTTENGGSRHTRLELQVSFFFLIRAVLIIFK